MVSLNPLERSENDKDKRCYFQTLQNYHEDDGDDEDEDDEHGDEDDEDEDDDPKMTRTDDGTSRPFRNTIVFPRVFSHEDGDEGQGGGAGGGGGR